MCRLYTLTSKAFINCRELVFLYGQPSNQAMQHFYTINQAMRRPNIACGNQAMRRFYSNNQYDFAFAKNPFLPTFNEFRTKNTGPENCLTFCLQSLTSEWNVMNECDKNANQVRKLI